MATYWVNTSTESPAARITSSSSSKASSLPERPAIGAGLAEVLRRVVADLLERGEQLEHEAAPADALRLGDLGHRLAHDRLVERHLLGGQRHEPIGLGLRRQLRRDAGVGLAPAQQEGPHQPGERVGGVRVAVALDRHGDPPAERLERAEQPGRGPVEDRPELGEAVLDRRAGEGDAGRRRDARAAPGPSAPGGFLACWASSATTQAPRLLGQGAVSRRTTP